MPKKILVSVLGLTPQVLTETLYYLVTHDFVPDEIHLITTRNGASNVKNVLLNSHNNILERLCEDMKEELNGKRYSLHDEKNENEDENKGNLFIHGLLNTDDIRNYDDNVEIADIIIDVIRVLSADPESTIHCSIAGGRKTMGFLAGYAMSLFGRTQDKLSHVLIEPEAFERANGFYYPSQRDDMKIEDPRTREILRASDARVMLADIPFIKLGRYIPNYLRDNRRRYSEIISLIQMSLSKDNARLSFGDPFKYTITCNGVPIKLDRAHYILYWWFLDVFFNMFDGMPFNPRQQIRTSDEHIFMEMIELHALISRNMERDRDARRNKIKKIKEEPDKNIRHELMQGYLRGFFTTSHTRLKQALEERLTPELSDLFNIVSKKGVGYSSNLKSEQVEFPKSKVLSPELTHRYSKE